MAGWINPRDVVIDRDKGCVQAILYEIDPDTSEKMKCMAKSIFADSPDDIRSLADHLEMQANYEIGGANHLFGRGAISVKGNILSGSMTNAKMGELALSGRVDVQDYKAAGDLYIIGDRSGQDIHVYRVLVDESEPQQSMEP